jgi:hypothetical protein
MFCPAKSAGAIGATGKALVERMLVASNTTSAGAAAVALYGLEAVVMACDS